MSAGDIKKEHYTWKSPLAVWGAKGRNYEVPTIRVEDPRSIWDKTPPIKFRCIKLEDLNTYISGQITGADFGRDADGG